MADRFYGINRGGTLLNVAEDSSTTSDHIEAVLDLAKSFSRAEFLMALSFFKNKILAGDWPQAAVNYGYAAMNINRGQTENDVTTTFQVAAEGTVTAASVEEADTVTIDAVELTAQDLRELTQVVCVADVASSLNDTFFTFSVLENDALVDYAVRISVDGAGSYAPVAGRVTLHANIAEDDVADDVAIAVHAVIDAQATGVTASISTDTIELLNDAIGEVTNAADGAMTDATGFTITTEREGAATPGADAFSIHGTDSDVAASIAAASNASAAAATVTATSLLAVVTFTAVDPGTGGNAITLASSDNTRLEVSDATLLGGAAAAVAGDVYLTVRSDASLERSEVLMGLDYIRDHVLSTNWPPA